MRADCEHLRPTATASNAASVVVLLLCLAFPALPAEQIVGSVKTVLGGVAVKRGSATLPCQEGFHVVAQDILQTSADGSVGVIFLDGTRIALGPNTEIKLDNFVFQPADGKFGLLLRLARGVMAYISGRIAQFSPESVRVETPVGTVGLRGTYFGISLKGE